MKEADSQKLIVIVEDDPDVARIIEQVLNDFSFRTVWCRSAGDLYCRVVVETPVNLTERQKELLREFDSCCSGHDGKHNPRAKGFMDKVKAFFAQ